MCAQLQGSVSKGRAGFHGLEDPEEAEIAELSRIAMSNDCATMKILRT
jgi:hypothetical protein